VVLANGRLKCGACDFGGSTELVHLVGVSISLEKNFYRLPFTPPLSGRLFGPSSHHPELPKPSWKQPKHRPWWNTEPTMQEGIQLPELLAKIKG
jgi:hypothetical protein